MAKSSPRLTLPSRLPLRPIDIRMLHGCAPKLELLRAKDLSIERNTSFASSPWRLLCSGSRTSSSLRGQRRRQKPRLAKIPRPGQWHMRCESAAGVERRHGKESPLEVSPAGDKLRRKAGPQPVESDCHRESGHRHDGLLVRETEG